MKGLFGFALAAALAAGPALAQDLAPERDANGVYQVIRTTDNSMTCEQLGGEINMLNASINAPGGGVQTPNPADAQAKTAKANRSAATATALLSLLGSAAQKQTPNGVQGAIPAALPGVDPNQAPNFGVAPGTDPNQVAAATPATGAKGLLSRAGPTLGMISALAANAASSAANTAGSALPGRPAKGGQPTGFAASEQQRLNRVNGLFTAHGC